jgi:uncharacterized protein (DUF2235 family)
MTRNLVVCCDGTNNTFGVRNTNVVRVLQSLVRDREDQLVYYDPGVGTMAAPGPITRIGKAISRGIDLAFGTGFNANVQDAYVWLMNNWQAGDRIYLFGFSRGAFTARVVAAMLHHVGLLPRGADNLVPYALRLLLRKTPLEIGDQFRRTFSRPTGDPERRIPVHFLGVWDTVSSVGWVWDPARYAFTANNPSVGIVRHAMALDERRAFYRQNLVGEPKPPAQRIQQLWFPGVHSDIGGGYADSFLWRAPFAWILREAGQAGLHLDPARAGAVVAPPVDKPWLEKKHNELRNPLWWICEVFPKMPRPWSVRINFFATRTLKDGELLHETTLRRIREDDTYRPSNLSRAFRDYVARMKDEEIPPQMAYRASATSGASAPTPVGPA